MNHDEKLNCGDRHIMSASTGNGKTLWSECSVIQLALFLSRLKKSGYSIVSLSTNVGELPQYNVLYNVLRESILRSMNQTKSLVTLQCDLVKQYQFEYIAIHVSIMLKGDQLFCLIHVPKNTLPQYFYVNQFTITGRQCSDKTNRY